MYVDNILSGIRVLDFTRVLAGPFATVLLADLGADVVKVEAPSGDDYRAIGPHIRNISGLFEAVNHNKRSIVLDLKVPAGRKLALELAKKADIVVENYRPGVAERLGVDYATLAGANPSVIYASISGFGQYGPNARKPAYDLIMQALCGLMSSTGFPDGPPTMVGESVGDASTGLFASWAIIAALYGRSRDGRGCHIDVAMFDSLLAFMVTCVVRSRFSQNAVNRVGNRHPMSAPFGAYKASDGYFVLTVLNDNLFRKLCSAIGQPGLWHDARFKTDPLRSRNEKDLRVLIETWSGERTISSVVQCLDAAGIPAAPICSVSDALRSEQARFRGLGAAVTKPGVGEITIERQPVKFGGWSETKVTGAPELGADTGEILSGILGLNRADIASAAERGAFGPNPTSVIGGGKQ